jgi:ethanolaminephosphotransferase
MCPHSEKKEVMASSSSSQTSSSSPKSEYVEECPYFYVTADAAVKLPHYQYKGEDRSLLYYYILSPLAAFCVNRLTPRTLAPNSITLVGLAFMVLSYLVMWYQVPTLLPQVNVPRWIFLYNAIAILVYQTLDNMDGKQARRTGSSSPLGLFFDHGCDAINSLFGSVNWMIAMALHPSRDSWLCWTMLFGPYGLFYIGTWEQYYTGELIMPIMNGPNEGLLGAVLMSLISWAFGPEYWHERDLWQQYISPVASVIVPINWLPSEGLRNADLLVLASTIGFIQEIGLKVLNVARVYGANALWNLLPFGTLIVCSLAVGWTDPQIWLDMPRTSLHLCAALFVDMTCDLMRAHMSEQPYQPIRWILFPLLGLTAAVTTGYYSAPVVSDVLMIYASAATMFLALKSVIVIHEICTVLSIWCFDIVTPRRPSKQNTANGHSKAE